MTIKKIEFIYRIRRPKKLKNNVFVLYSPEGIKLQPGETKMLDMKLKIKLPKELIGTCTLLNTFTENGIQILNSQFISPETNFARNHFVQNNKAAKEDFPWNLKLELFNQNLTKTLKIRKRQEVGFFLTLNDRGEEIRYVYTKEH